MQDQVGRPLKKQQGETMKTQQGKAFQKPAVLHCSVVLKLRSWLDNVKFSWMKQIVGILDMGLKALLTLVDDLL